MEPSLVLAKFDSLIEKGLVFYDDEQQTVELVDQGLKFQFIITYALANKPTFQVAASQSNNAEKLPDQERVESDINTTGYEICDSAATHLVAANKFCFARPHLMILTHDANKRQYESLDLDDWQAIGQVLVNMGEEYIAFFNCGQDGGCSRLHKHMQLIPKPKSSFAAFLDTEDGIEPDVPFQWFHHRFNDALIYPTELLFIYQKLLREATEVGKGLFEHADSLPAGAAVPHNVLVTNRWMVVIPRRQAGVDKVAGANAIGMVGVIPVASSEEIGIWEQIGPANVLRKLGVPNTRWCY